MILAEGRRTIYFLRLKALVGSPSPSGCLHTHTSTSNMNWIWHLIKKNTCIWEGDVLDASQVGGQKWGLISQLFVHSYKIQNNEEDIKNVHISMSSL